MTEERKLHGQVVMRIMHAATRVQVGWLYEWNNGDQEPLWFDKPVRAVVYAPL